MFTSTFRNFPRSGETRVKAFATRHCNLLTMTLCTFSCFLLPACIRIRAKYNAIKVFAMVQPFYRQKKGRVTWNCCNFRVSKSRNWNLPACRKLFGLNLLFFFSVYPAKRQPSRRRSGQPRSEQQYPHVGRDGLTSPTQCRSCFCETASERV